jgi:hypothetical protein
MVKERGRCAVRWHCLRCGATGVDAAPAVPTSLADVNTWPVEQCIPHVRIQLASDAEVLLFVGTVLWWRAPLSLASWIRANVFEVFGVVSETVCAAAVWLMLERASGPCESDSRLGEQRPWTWQWASGRGSEHAPRWRVSSSEGITVDGYLQSWPWMLDTATGRAATVSRNPRAPTASASDSDSDGEDTPSRVHGLSDSAFFTAVVIGAVPGLDSHMTAGSGGLGPSSARDQEEHDTEAQLARTWASRLWMWVSNTARAIPDEGYCSALVAARPPWPAASYVPPPLWDRTVRSQSEEACVPTEAVLSPFIPLLSAPVQPGVSTLAAPAWQECLEGAAQQAAVVTGLQWGFPLMVSPTRSHDGAHIRQCVLSSEEAAAVSAYVDKSRKLGHMVDVSHAVQVPAGCGWVAPFVTVPKAGEPGQFRVCHHASAVPEAPRGPRGPEATSLASLNGDTDYSPISPVTLLYLEWVVQRYRYLRATHPDQPILGWKMDAKHWFRQVPTRARDRHLLLQRWDGVLWAHLVLTFGLCAAVHLCGLLSNGLADVAMVLFGIVIRAFVDDIVCLEVGPRAAWSMGAVRLLGIFLGWLWNPAKEVGPCDTLPILGVTFNLATGRATVSAARAEVVVASCERLLQLASDKMPTTVGVLQELAGVCTFLSAVVPFGRAHTVALHRLAGGGDGSRSAPRWLDTEAVLSLQWWRQVLVRGAVPTQPLDWGVSPAREIIPVHRVRVDAAGGVGLGALVEAQGLWVLHDLWSDVEKSFSNNVLECAAATIVVAACAHRFSGGLVLLETDNMCTLWCLRKGTAKKPVLRWLTMFVSDLQEEFRFLLRVSHCSGVRLVGADAASRQRNLEGLLPRVPGSAWVSCPIPAPARHLGPVACGLLPSNQSLARSFEQNLVCDISRVSRNPNPYHYRITVSLGTECEADRRYTTPKFRTQTSHCFSERGDGGVLLYRGHSPWFSVALSASLGTSFPFTWSVMLVGKWAERRGQGSAPFFFPFISPPGVSLVVTRLMAA